jgi:hypothetical protein
MKHFLIIILSILIITAICYDSDDSCKVKEGFGLDFLWFPICIVIGIFKFLGGVILGVVWLIECFPKLPDLIAWAVKGFMCGIIGLINLPKCFLWYLLEWIGWVLYLPFRFIFYLMDLVMNAIIGKTGVVKFEHQVWCWLEDLDKSLHKTGGFHIIHYPDSVIEKCYTCKMPKYPDLPKFPKQALDLMQNAFNC